MTKSLFVFLAFLLASNFASGEEQIRKLSLKDLKTALEQPLPEKCDLIAQFNKQTGSLEVSLKKDSAIVSVTIDPEPAVYAFLAKNENDEWFNLYQYSKIIGSSRTDLFLQSELYGNKTVGLRLANSEKQGDTWIAKTNVDCSAKPTP